MIKIPNDSHLLLRNDTSEFEFKRSKYCIMYIQKTIPSTDTDLVTSRFRHHLGRWHLTKNRLLYGDDWSSVLSNEYGKTTLGMEAMIPFSRTLFHSGADPKCKPQVISSYNSFLNDVHIDLKWYKCYCKYRNSMNYVEPFELDIT